MASRIMFEPIFSRKILPGVEHNGLAADIDKVVLDFIAIEHGILGEDLLDKHPQLGNVPLPVTEVIHEIPDCFLGHYFEGIV